MKVDVTVVVVVSDRSAKIVARAGKARPLGHVLENQIAEVAVESIPEARFALLRRPSRRRARGQLGAVREKRIETTPPSASNIATPLPSSPAGTSRWSSTQHASWIQGRQGRRQ